MDTDEIWESIMNHDGSVQQLEFLTENERDVFKTFREIDQYAIIDQAADRQVYIDQ
jgi:ribonucleoside-diphosphate reductase alpha chain